VAQRGFAGAVRAHDRVHLSRLHVEREALEDFLASDGGVEVFDLQHDGQSRNGLRSSGTGIGLKALTLAPPVLPAGTQMRVLVRAAGTRRSWPTTSRRSSRCQPMRSMPR